MSSLNPTIDVRAGEELDVAAVDAALKEAILDLSGSGLAGTPIVTQYASGASNLTYALDYDTHKLVLRRPPFGTKPKSGHDMHREYRIMSALKPVFPTVPKTVFYSDDETIIGAEFYVMERVDGHLIHKDIPHDWNWGPADASALCENYWSKLVELHRVDYQSIGLGGFGRPDGYIARQIGGWNSRFERAWTPDVDQFQDVRDWLAGEQPSTESGASILHGDYRIDNCILNRDDPTQIDAILDWEICALGDPLMDLGNALAYWIEPGDADDLKSIVMQPSMTPGMMSRNEVLDFTGRKRARTSTAFSFSIFMDFGVWR